MNDNLIHFNGVSKIFKRHEGLRQFPVKALDNVSFAMQRGEFLGLIGHNGAGKSTAIKLLMGFLEPSQGQVSVRGISPNQPGARRNLGYVPENSSFSDFLTGTEIITAFGLMGGLSKEDCAKRSTQLLEALGIAHACNRLVKTYSKGMTQRLAIAQALIGKPEVLILDEPMTGLDPIGRRMVLDVLGGELERGVCLLFCSHLLADVEQLCERVLWLNRGKVHYDGPIKELLSARSVYELIYRGQTAIRGALKISKDLYRAEISPEELRDMVLAVEQAGGRVEAFQQATKALEEIFIEAAETS